MTPDRALVTDWLIALLKADPAGYGVGDHKAPDGPVDYPYWVAWSIPGGSLSGPPLGAGQADAALVYQVDSVGRTRAQAEKMAARARGRISDRHDDGTYATAAEHPTGMTVSDRIAEGSAGAPLVEGSYPNEVYTVSERFVISVSAS